MTQNQCCKLCSGMTETGLATFIHDNDCLCHQTQTEECTELCDAMLYGGQKCPHGKEPYPKGDWKERLETIFLAINNSETEEYLREGTENTIKAFIETELERVREEEYKSKHHEPSYRAGSKDGYHDANEANHAD